MMFDILLAPFGAVTVVSEGPFLAHTLTHRKIFHIALEK